jgi:O-antigen/teichoic acid export membrane protein
VIEDPLVAGDAGPRVIRGGGARVAAYVGGVLAGLVSAPLVIRHLGIEDYGRFAVVLSITFIATALTEGGLQAVAVRRYTVADHTERRALIAALGGLRIVLSIAGTAVVMAFAVLAGYEEVILAGVGLGCLALVLNNLWGALQVALVAQLRLVAVAATEIVRSASTTLLLVALVVGGSTLLPFYVVAPVAAAITLAVSAWVVRREVPLRPAIDLARWRALLRETAVYAGASALGALYFQVGMVAMSLLTDDRETGLYGIAFRIVELANGVPWLLAGSAFPIFAHAAARDPERLRYAVGRVTEAGMIVGGAFAVIMVLGARFGIDLVAGAEAHDSIPVLRFMSIGVTATFLVAAWGFVLLSRQRYRELLVVNAAAFALAILLAVTLIPAFGAQGGGAATAALEVSLAVMYGVLVARELPGVRAGAALAARLILALGAAFAVGVPLLALHSIPATIAGTATYAGVLWVTRAIPPELLDALRRRRPS